MFGIPIGTLFQVISASLKLLNQVMEKLERERMIDLGQKEQIAKNLAELQLTLDITKEVDKYVKERTDSELDDILVNGV